MSGVEVLRTEQSRIQKTPGVCGGDACVRYTRIPVWSVIRATQLGASGQHLLNYFVTPLTAADVDAAKRYYEANRDEIERTIVEDEEA
jgi:uncharacterized protein (DUF433 family)